jgi:hypothetical protein
VTPVEPLRRIVQANYTSISLGAGGFVSDGQFCGVNGRRRELGLAAPDSWLLVFQRASPNYVELAGGKHARSTQPQESLRETNAKHDHIIRVDCNSDAGIEWPSDRMLRKSFLSSTPVENTLAVRPLGPRSPAQVRGTSSPVQVGLKSVANGCRVRRERNTTEDSVRLIGKTRGVK